MNVQVFMCKFGAGHLKASQELEKQLNQLDHTQVHVIDFIESIYPKLADLIYWTHHHYYQRRVLSAEEKELKDTHFRQEWTCKLLMLEKIFFKYLDSLPTPDIYVSCFSVTSYLLGIYKRKRGLSVPLVTYITDFNFHPLWINDETDLYLVMSQFTKEQLESIGVPSQRVMVFGSNNQKPIHKSNQHVLICGGGLGMLPDDKVFYQSLEKYPDKEFKIVFGKNDKLYNKVSKWAIKNATLYQYVTDMTPLYHWADVYITKPGGMSIYDSIKNELPLVYFTPFLPQEIRNKQFIQHEKIGVELVDDNLDILEQFTKDEKAFGEAKASLCKIRKDFSPQEFIGWLEHVHY
ncbi:MGDG synthase family glycosyltransferase [Dolosicoccus paucivorans]|uniref:Galactosyldiacylglycerol synthase n=1 Tax=Dolosicoccus paucivorans TaxID=84521 RepID=A0A2N6SKW8_9LACT|nr:glycosyltransferase [Dolosicoccus paucivorans]PMB83576.1 hypothetical protein CJ206_08480 [Dolosicoccus paucivorans]PMC56703.1 hypothetical protein CJ205_08365 [Dolosicoccus paucivorans]